MRYVLGVVVALAMVGCDSRISGADASQPSDARATADRPSVEADSGPQWGPCDGCMPVCAGGEPVCITNPGTSHDCDDCIVACGNYTTPRSETVSCSPSNTPVCEAIGEQALYCYRMGTD